MPRPRLTYTCTVEGCGESHRAKGLCRNHYREIRKQETRLSDSAYDSSSAGRYRSCKHKAKVRRIKFELTFEQYEEIFQKTNHCCYYCGGGLPSKGSGLDRLDPNGGYTPNNVVPCCMRCNLAKGPMSEPLFLSYLAKAGERAKQMLLQGRNRALRALTKDSTNG